MTGVFEFERDFANSLRCVPMAVRLKLDLSGVKLSLRQWSRFTVDDRQSLLLQPCDTAEEIGIYRATLVELVANRAGESAKPLLDNVSRAEWEQSDRAPDAVADHARSVSTDPPTNAQWSGLTRLQRFTLIKLSRDHHDNINFIPALHEFGVLAPRQVLHVA